jgi:hypothetical protein
MKKKKRTHYKVSFGKQIVYFGLNIEDLNECKFNTEFIERVNKIILCEQFFRKTIIFIDAPFV